MLSDILSELKTDPLPRNDPSRNSFSQDTEVEIQQFATQYLPYQKKSPGENIQVDPSQEIGQNPGHSAQKVGHNLGQESISNQTNESDSTTLLNDIIDELKSSTPVITKKKSTKLKIVRKSSTGTDRKKSVLNKTPPSDKDFRKLETEFKNLSPFKSEEK